MKTTKTALRLLTAASLTLGVGLASSAHAQPPPPAGDVEAQRHAIEQQARPTIEQQRKEAEQEAAKNLNNDAAEAVKETRNAYNALQGNNPKEAMAAIERATGKVDILLARQPAAALVMSQLEVQIIDAAPPDREGIKKLAKAAEKAVGDKEYPTARVELAGMISEIRIRTYNVPLATYPMALKAAARLLDQQKPQEAQALLGAALDTLVVVDRVIPLPLVVARAAIDRAEQLHNQDRGGARMLLAVAKAELERTKELGYAGNDPEYAAMDKQLADLDAQLKGKEDPSGAIARLKDKLTAFYKRLYAKEHH